MFPHQALKIWLKQSKCNGILVTNANNIGYLTGFWGSFGIYLQTNKGRYLLTDGRYRTLATKKAADNGFEFMEFKGGIPESFIAQLNGDLAVEDSISLAQLKHYRRWFKGIKLKPHTHVVEKLRKTKSKTELKLMRTAQNQVDKVLIPFLKENLRIGVSEKQLKFKLEQALRLNGEYDLSFDTIVGFGSGSASPHYSSGNKKLKQGHNILIDCGVINKHYCSDMTRNFVFGSVEPSYLKNYQQLLAAQNKTLKKVKAGVKAHTLDKFCRTQMGEAAEFFTHSLGHGVGIEIHESPTLSPRSKDRLQANEVVTVEPGFYWPKKYGIRIEDTVIVQADGCEILTKTTKDLLSFSEEGRVQILHKAA